MVKRRYEESIIQAEAVRALSIFGVYVFMVPNGEISDMNARKYQRLVSLGFRAGISDTVVMGSDGKAHFLEFKKPGGKQSPAQILFQEKCSVHNWPYAVVDSAIGAVDQVRAWGIIKQGGKNEF